MFGLGKIFGGIFDKMGLGWLGNLLTVGIDFMSGDWMSLVGDISNLVSRFSDLSFIDRVAGDPPLGELFGQGSGLDNFSLTSGRLDNLLESALGDGLQRLPLALEVAKDAIGNHSILAQERERVQYAAQYV